MKNHLLYQPTRSSRAETAVFASLGVVALFTVMLAALSMTSFVQGKDAVVATLSGGAPAASASGSRAGYIKSGRWLADARTLVAMARWVLEPDVVRTNVAMAPSNASRAGAVATTNSAGVTPKA